MKKKEYILIYTTFPTKKTARKNADILVNKKAVVCANFRPHESVYSWNGRIIHEKECGVWLKTRDDKWKSVRKFILKNHPYKTPIILKIKIDGSNRGLKEWIDDSLVSQKWTEKVKE